MKYTVTIKEISTCTVEVDADSCEEAILHFIEEGRIKKGSRLYKAWYKSEFREYIPSIYYKEYMDFEKYPLNY